MTNRLLLSVATAALIAGTGFANAQGTGMSRESPSSGSTVQQQPSSGGGAMQHDRSGTTGPKGAEHSGGKGSDSGMKSTDSTDKAQPGAAGKSAQEKSKSMSSETDTKGSKDMKAEGRDKSGSTAAESRDKDGSTNAQTKGSQTTTGNAATSATAAPPAEKRTQIVSAIKSEKVEEVTNVNFNVSVGTVVPTTVRFHPLPPRIVEIYPEWRGYEFILVKGRYVIVRPQTHEIVYIIEG